MIEVPQYDRRRDDSVRIPRNVVLALIVALIVSIPGTMIGGAVWVAHQADTIASMSEKLDGFGKKLDEIRSDIIRREAFFDQRLSTVDTAERVDQNDITRLQSSAAYLLRKQGIDDNDPPPGPTRKVQ